jgi:hypothetical protein
MPSKLVPEDIEEKTVKIPDLWEDSRTSQIWRSANPLKFTVNSTT